MHPSTMSAVPAPRIALPVPPLCLLVPQITSGRCILCVLSQLCRGTRSGSFAAERARPTSCRWSRERGRERNRLAPGSLFLQPLLGRPWGSGTCSSVNELVPKPAFPNRGVSTPLCFAGGNGAFSRSPQLLAFVEMVKRGNKRFFGCIRELTAPLLLLPGRGLLGAGVTGTSLGAEPSSVLSLSEPGKAKRGRAAHEVSFSALCRLLLCFFLNSGLFALCYAPFPLA